MIWKFVNKNLTYVIINSSKQGDQYANESS